MNYNAVVCMSMQSSAVAWFLVALLVLGCWRMWRAMKRNIARMQSARAEAFSHAVSKAVAEGVATAISASIADSTAAASGGNVNLHIGDRVASLIADHYDGTDDYDDEYDRGSVLRSGGRRGVGSLPDSARRGELASRRTPRDRIASRTRSGNIHSESLPGGELA